MSEKRRDNKGRILREGEIQRSDGRYVYRYTDCTGKRIAVYSWKLVSTDKLKSGQRECQALRDLEKQIQRDREDGIRADTAARITVDDLFLQFLDLRKDLKESSRCNYADIYNSHIKPALGHRPIKKVRPTEIQKLYQAMVYENGMHPSTAQKAHSIIYQMFENAVMDNILRTNPASNAFRNFRRTTAIAPASKDPLTAEEQRAFINYVYDSSRYRRYACLFTVLLGTGMRIGEALGLRWCDCDFEEGVIRITHTLTYKPGLEQGYHYSVTSPKTLAGNREIPMFEEVKVALLRQRPLRPKKFSVGEYTDFVFLNSAGKVYTPNAIYDALQGIVTSYNKEEYLASLEEEREPVYLPKISAHILRHTFCTRMCENNVNLKVLQDIMGHRNIRTTMEVYTKALKDTKVEAIRSLEGAFQISGTR